MACTNCTICPRKCGADRTQIPVKAAFCGESEEIRIASACLHFGEEPLVTVKGGSGTIFFTGCNLRCAFCQNYQISQQGLGKAVSSRDFSEICLKLQELGAENINLVTGSHFSPMLAEYIKSAKEAGLKIPVCWNSSGYDSIQSLESLRNVVDIFLPDFKTLSQSLAKSLFGAANYPQVAKSAISWMINNFPLKIKNNKIMQGVIIRHLFLPGNLDDTVQVLSWLKENADKKACISLMSQYTPVPFKEDSEKFQKRKKALSVIENRFVNQQEDLDLRDFIEAFDFDYLFYQELNADSDWLPDFTRVQPFSNKLAKPVWHYSSGFVL